MSATLVADAAALADVVDACARAERIAVDAEANGMFAYRPRLCSLQLAWHERGSVRIAILDTLALDPAPLAAVLGAAGPVKVLHDLTFDARLLASAGVTLGRVRDTSVAARFLGREQTGLASLCSTLLGVSLEKAFQDHDWATRPLSAQQLAYLADDVRHLLDLDDVLTREVGEKGIADEIAVECDYKLGTAFGPIRDDRPPHVRIKGYHRLDPRGRAVLRRLCEAREQLAEERDVPAFRIVHGSMMLELARRKPTSEDEVRRACGRDRAAKRFVAEWLAAVTKGLDDGPEAKPPIEPPPANLAERRQLERAVNEWRKERAAERGVDAQVVVPGHCVDAVASALSGQPCAHDLRRALLAIPGFGNCRVDRYADSLAELGSAARV